MQNRQIPRELEMLRLLAQGRVDTSPLKLVAVQREPNGKGQPKTSEADAIIKLGWGKKVYRFVVECKAVSTPKEIAAAVETAKRSSAPPRSFPMIFVPYLPPSQLRLLEERQVNGIDLSGNALIAVPNEMLVFRTGAPNTFRRPGMIKNVYRKNSSIVPRVFLLKARYNSITEVMEEIESRGGDVSQATVSKVCASLDQDLVIERTKGQVPRTRSLRLIQPDKLLDLLAENYAPPAINQRLTAKTTLTPDQFRRRLMQWRSDAAEKAALTGSSSADQYAVIAREPIQSLYCSNLESLLATVGPDLEETSRFANIELLETDEDFVYFDIRDNLAASPVQTYLELMQGDKREQQTAEQLRKTILRPLENKG
ncbi:MAG: hypothetical protein ACOY3P_12095 [Planctomycetota bacterium]